MRTREIFLAALLAGCSSGDDGGSGGAGASDPGSTGTTPSTTSGPGCGDGTCSPTESCDVCGADCSSYGASPETTALDGDESSFLTLLNEYRSQNGLPAIAGCVSLHRAAQGHSEDMRDHDYFAHEGLDGSAPWDRACGACYMQGCGPMTAMGENIAAGNADAFATLEQWKASPPHDANMRDPSFLFIGVGRASGGGRFGVYWTNVFAGADEPSCH
jgi:uncharacterized protein YkwD